MPLLPLWMLTLALSGHGSPVNSAPLPEREHVSYAQAALGWRLWTAPEPAVPRPGAGTVVQGLSGELLYPTSTGACSVRQDRLS